jgi:trigger factor
MKVNIENISGTERKMSVVLPLEQVQEIRTAVFDEISKSAKIKGFRPGKAPVNVIESAYKNEILSEVATRLVHESLESALNEVDASPITRPQIDPPKEFTTDKDFEYTAVFEVLPEFEVSEYKELPLKKEVGEVSDEDIEQALKHLREHRAEVKPYEEEKAVEAGDIAVIDFEGSLDGEPIEDLKKTDVPFVVGEHKMIPEFEENVIGMKKGEEKEFDVTYDEDFQIEEAAGKKVNFKLVVKDVQERILPELSDELAKEIGVDDLESLKVKIKEDLGRQLDQQSQTKLRADLLDVLVERNEVDAPPSLVHEEAHRLAQGIQQNLQQRGMPERELDEEAQRMIAERSLRNVKASIILGAISRAEEIKVSEEDINENLSGIAQSYNISTEQVREIYEQNKLLDGLEANLAEQKVIDFIIENAKIEEVPSEQNHVDNVE